MILWPASQNGGNPAASSLADGIWIRVQSSHAITAVHQLAPNLPVPATNLKNRRAFSDVRDEKLYRFSSRHIDRSIYNEVEHFAFWLCEKDNPTERAPKLEIRERNLESRKRTKPAPKGFGGVRLQQVSPESLCMAREFSTILDFRKQMTELL